MKTEKDTPSQRVGLVAIKKQKPCKAVYRFQHMYKTALFLLGAIINRWYI